MATGKTTSETNDRSISNTQVIISSSHVACFKSSKHMCVCVCHDPNVVPCSIGVQVQLRTGSRLIQQAYLFWVNVIESKLDDYTPAR